MSTNEQVGSVSGPGNELEGDLASRIAIVRKVGGLLLRLLQTALAIEAGMGIYHLLGSTLLARMGYAVVTDPCPVIGYLVMGLCMVVPTIALTRFWHGATGRYSMQLSALMLVALATLALLAFGHVISVKAMYSLGAPSTYAAVTVFVIVRSCLHAESIPEEGSAA